MPYNQELVEKTAEFIKAKNSGYIVKCGFMNMNKPTIRESLEAFRHEPIEALVVVPLFLAKGVHIEKDIPGEIGLAGRGQERQFCPEREIRAALCTQTRSGAIRSLPN